MRCNDETPFSARRLTPALILAATLVAAFSSVAAAKRVCLPRDKLVALLAERYHEARVSGGLAANGRLVEVFATEDGATWTLVATTPVGLSCAVGSGEAWRRIDPKAPEGPKT
jgi:hypothetical protein